MDDIKESAERKELHPETPAPLLIYEFHFTSSLNEHLSAHIVHKGTYTKLYMMWHLITLVTTAALIESISKVGQWKVSGLEEEDRQVTD